MAWAGRRPEMEQHFRRETVKGKALIVPTKMKLDTLEASPNRWKPRGRDQTDRSDRFRRSLEERSQFATLCQVEPTA